MSINVYNWPPVDVVGAEWTRDDPVQQSRSAITGAVFRSAAGRSRRLATLVVPGLGTGQDGAGYMEVLKRLLAGRHAVRLQSYPVNYFVHQNAIADQARSTRLTWTDDEIDLDWTAGGTDLYWYTGRLIWGTTGTDADGFDVVSITGAPANTRIALPGQFLTLFADVDDVTGETVMVMTEAITDGDGAADIRIFGDELTQSYTSARVNIGTRDTGVFLPVGELPRAVQPVSGGWSYKWSFREVFADEVGGFVEVDPW